MHDDTLTLRQRWLRLCAQSSLGGVAAEAMWDVIASNHDSPGRAYHNLCHIRDCLEQFDAVSESAREPVVVEFAIWFHDLVYDSKANDNEERSAMAAADFLKRTGIAERVCSLVLATRHKEDPQDEDARLICDIDLSILGRDAQTYKSYSESIRREYAWVDEASYREGRRKVLENFLRREHVYHLQWFRERYEQQARLNLQQEVTQLIPVSGNL